MNINSNQKLFFPIDPIIQTQNRYQNLNKNINLRKSITLFFYKKANKWKTKYKINIDFNNHDIYKILKYIFKKYNTNWYDYEYIYLLIKKYILKNLFLIKE